MKSIEDTKTQPLGYSNPAYADSLSEIGHPLSLPSSEAFLLERRVGKSSFVDLMGPYPIFSCENWSSLKTDIENLGNNYVSLTLVTDAFADVTSDEIKQIFPDKCLPYKNHFIVNLSLPLEKIVSQNHRYKVRRALRTIKVKLLETPGTHLDAWCNLYEILIQRHNINGIQKFSKNSFEKLFKVPGVHVFVAELEDNLLGMQVWLHNKDFAYYHLAAYNETGYQKSVSYAMFWHILSFFQQSGTSKVDLGGGPGNTAEDNGLIQFKRGWSNETRQVFLCGRILHQKNYELLTKANNSSNSSFFPKYRSGEII